jgi:EmrB/QacA subfamily drug resistance transporter
MMSVVRPPGDESTVRQAADTPGCASHAKRWVLIATVLGSGTAFLEASVINVALPSIQDSFSPSVPQLQAIGTAYTVSLAALGLAAGGAGDRFGKLRLFLWGAAGLALTSLACGLAANVFQLIAGRALQGLAAALLVPNSLALLSASFPKAERGRAIGIWSGATAVFGAGGPVVGGWLVDIASWRGAFLLVVPPALLTLLVARWRVPVPPTLRRAPPVDWIGAALSTCGIAGFVAAIILSPGNGLMASLLLIFGTLAVASFDRFELRNPAPMVPPRLLRSRSFFGVNTLTLLLYFAVTSAFFLLPFDLIQVQHYSAMAAGAAFLPFAIIVGVLSRFAGGITDRWGARRVLVLGSLTTALGLALFAIPGIGGSYWSTFFPPMATVGLGMAISVTPLTTVVLDAVEPAEAGIASGMNGTFARVASLLAVSIVGVAAFGLFTREIDRRVALASLPPSLRQELARSRQSFAETNLPDSVPARDRMLLERILAEAFVTSFRSIAGLSAGVALAAALATARTVRRCAPAQDQDLATMAVCTHLDQVIDVKPSSPGCEECLRTGDRWVHLRLCLSCGHVGCCDSSKNRHATTHFWATNHPIVRSLQPGEDWRWCYIDEIVT